MRGKNTERFFIVCAPRTGSTMLRLMLNSHPDICCHGEVLNSATIYGLVDEAVAKDPSRLTALKAARRHDPLGFLRRHILNSNRKHVVGAKLLYSVFENNVFAPATRYIIEDKSIKIVHLTRRNLLRRMLSFERLLKTSTPVLTSIEQKTAAPKITVSYDALKADVEDIRSKENYFRGVFAGHPMFEICYEDIHPDAEPVKKLQQFLGVEPAALFSPTIKQSNDHLPDQLENYGELLAAVRGTPLEAFFF